VSSSRLRTLQRDGDGILVLDQTRLPEEAALVRLDSLESVANAITTMQVRGAPLIGATAAYGVAIGIANDASDERLNFVIQSLAATRPTAVNLRWALARMQSKLRQLVLVTRCHEAWGEAQRIATEDEAANAAIGTHGLAALRDLRPTTRPIQVLTHCNAGRLATVDHGTALAPVYAAHAAGLGVHVWVSETRPRNQGLLTAWELAEAGVPHTLIADNAAGLLMMRGQVDLVLVGADRIAANGDTANKIGTYLKALAARENRVPFYVAAPVSTFDFACPSGGGIPIEERSASELYEGDSAVANPAFDITPAHLITGFITEHGLFSAAELAKREAAWMN